MKKLLNSILAVFILVAWEGFLVYGVIQSSPGGPLFYVALFLLLSQAYVMLLSMTIYRSERKGKGELSLPVTIGVVLSAITVAVVWLVLHAFKVEQ